jgi:hypothetical protein
MNAKIIAIGAALAVCTMLNVYAEQPGTVPKVEQKKSSRPAAQEPERTITYEELADFKGKRIIVHSKTGITRSGTLTKYSGMQIDIALDGNGLQFSYIHDAIKSIGIPITPEPAPGDDSAKKN